MISGKIYAKSFFEIAKEQDCQLFLQEFTFLKTILEQNPQLALVFNNYVISFGEKAALIDQVFGKDFHPHLVNGLKLIVEKRDFNKIGTIIDKTIAFLQKHLGISEGIIYSPVEINDFQIEKITALMRKKVNKKVVFKNYIDKELLGGVKIILDKKIYDNTISHHLKQLYGEIKERLEK